MDETRKETAKAGLVARLNVKFAQAHAELDEHLNDLGTHTEVLAFVPMAAKTSDTSLPAETTSPDDDNMVVKLQAEGNSLRLSIESLGFTRAQEVAGRFANVRSQDGLLNYDFRFDKMGCGSVLLADTPDVRRALMSGWQISLEA
ncbi:hypothetical protein [Roseobacter sp.]|uniref:hypothetical protein n=1 Tax=Roseobacter sp. TaxID=1907202 RepID=UPI00260D9233|nr:hypothetical protein [Roseobacter sp.]MDW3184286.1 hypothetical protein [Roseobacter sp.]